MRLRTVRGVRFPAKCACGCSQRLQPDPNLEVVVDFETSRPRLTYLPTHSPDYGSYPNDPVYLPRQELIYSRCLQES